MGEGYMQLGNMWAENFMSIIDAQVDFINKGLTLVEGINDDSEAFESNGSGKSTVFTETVVWVLYGETIRGQKGDKVINRNVGKNTKVVLEIIEDNGDVYKVERYRKHKEHKNHVRLFHNDENITGKSDKDTDQLIVDLLQMDYSTFTNSVMFGQGVTKMFASSTDSEQKKILENMLQIDIYKACQDKAKQYLTDIDRQRKVLDGDIKVQENQIKTTNDMIAHAQEKEAKLEEEVMDKISKLDDEWSDYNTELQMLPDIMALQDEADGYAVLVTKLDERIERYKEPEENLLELISDKKSLQRLLLTINKDIDTKKSELADIRAGKNIPKSCKACGQDLPLEDTSHIENHLEEAIEELQKEYNSNKLLLNETEALIEKVHKLLEGKKPQEEQRKTLQDAIKDIEREIVATVNREKEIQKLQARILKQIDEQKALLKTTYSDYIEQAIKMVNEVKEKLEDNRKALEALDTEYSHYEFWVNSYGNQGIKSVLLDSVTPFLNTQANRYLGQLADSSIEVKFNTQQQLKSGEKRDKFSVEVINHNGDDDYKSNSNGEKRRIDVAVNMALQDLVASRSNKRVDLLVYDEVFEGLDSIGSEAVIELLKEKARKVGSVLVITHNAALKQLFTKSLVVRKENARTVIEDEAV
jgi:DNA repair exonuclease SbcCD ATPase subunit